MSFWIQLPKPIAGLAPMHGVTNYLLRELQCQLAKPDVFFTEFVSAEGLARVPDKFTTQLQYSVNQKPICCQLFGYDPNSFTKAITVAYKQGFDGIDINMGCPSSKVLGIGGGAALIGNYRQVDKILNTCRMTCQKYCLPLSVKTRVIQNKQANADWFTFLTGYPLSAITVHGRYISQEHHGNIHSDRLHQAVDVICSKNTIALINGGITDITDGNTKCLHHKADGFLIGQAAIGNPYVFSSYNTKVNVHDYLLSIVEVIKPNMELYRIADLKHFTLLSLKGWSNVKQLKIAVSLAKDSKALLATLSEFVKI